MDDFFDPVYRGAASPATVFGVPMMPFLVGTLIGAQLGLLGFALLGLAGVVPVVIAYAFAYAWARRVSRNDEQRILQLWLRLRLRRGQGSAKAVWGAPTYAPGPER